MTDNGGEHKMRTIGRISVLAVVALVCSGGAFLGASAPQLVSQAEGTSAVVDQGSGVNAIPEPGGSIKANDVACNEDLLPEERPTAVEVKPANTEKPTEGLEKTPLVIRRGPTVTDIGVDGNGNGLYEYLLVEATFNLPEPGYYELQGVVFSNDDCCFIAAESNVAIYDRGWQTMSLSFFGYLIEQSGFDGPYTVHLVVFSGVNGFGESVDHMTREYSHGQFEPYSEVYPPKELWIESVDVEMTSVEPGIEGTAYITILVGPDRQTPIVEGEVYILIAHAEGTIPDSIVWDNGAGFTVFEGENGITLEFTFSLAEHGPYVAGAYLTSIENPEVVTCEFEA